MRVLINKLLFRTLNSLRKTFELVHRKAAIQNGDNKILLLSGLSG